MTSKIPRGVQLPAEMKKIGHKVESKDTVTISATAHVAQKSDGVTRPQKENVPRRNVAPKVQKGASSRYGQQAELKEQNQHLLATNEELQKNLTNTQQRVTELELQFSNLEKENAGLEKSLRDCHVLLVAAKVDPGERSGETGQQHEEQRKEVMSVSKNLLNELKAFGEIASEQRARLQEFQTVVTELTKAREHMTQERENFSLEAAEIENALREADALLF